MNQYGIPDSTLKLIVNSPWNFTAPWSDMLDEQNKMTNEYNPLIQELLWDMSHENWWGTTLDSAVWVAAAL